MKWLSKKSNEQGSPGVGFKVSLLLTLMLLSVLLMAAGGAYAATYYMATNGYDNGPGTSSAPWLTFSKAWSVLKPGDTLYLMDGTYTKTNTGGLGVTVPSGTYAGLTVYPVLPIAGSGTSNNPITIKALNEGNVFIDGQQNNLCAYLAGQSYINIDGLNFQGCRKDSAISVTCGSNHVSFHRDIIRDFGYADNIPVCLSDNPNGGYSSGSAGFSIDNDPNTTNNLLEDSAIDISGYCGDCLYTNMRNSARAGVNNWGQGNTFRRVYIRWNPNQCTGENVFLQNYNGNASNNLIENCVLDGTGEQTGASVASALLLAHYGNSNNNRALGNILNSVKGYAIDASTSDATYGSNNNVVTNNVCINPQYGIANFGDDNFTVSNNTVIGTMVAQTPANSADTRGLNVTLKTNSSNNSYLNCAGGGLVGQITGAEGTASVSSNFDNIYQCVPAIGGNVSAANTKTINPNYDTTTYGNGAYLMPPPALKGNGAGGTDIGANVIYEYQNGVLTSTPLWPWPMEARIAAELGVSVTYANGGGIWKTLSGVYSGQQPVSTVQPATVTITTTAGSGGSISPSGPVTVISGGSQTFSITPNTGYVIGNVTVDGASAGAVSTYSFGGVTANHTISATFVTNSFTITATTGAGGAISPSGSVTVNQGGSQTYTITSSTGYSISNVQVDGASAGAVNSYTFRNVTASHTISAAFTPTATSSPSSVYVSDLPFVGTPVNGWGPVEKDMSNGESAAGDGHTITLHGVTYAKGLGTHANSVVTYNLGGQYTSFISDIGIDDEVGSGGSVVFQVWADGVKLFDSGIMTHDSATQHVSVNVTGKSQLQLVVNVGTTSTNDHADWAGAQLSTTVGTYVSDLPFVGTPVNGWGPVERDMSNGEQAAGDGHTITLHGVTYAKGLGTHANSVVTYNLGGQYTSFISDIGIDDEVGSGGSVVFQVWADGVKLFDSGIMTHDSATQHVSVNVTGKSQLQLVVNVGTTSTNDHADWAGAQLSSAQSAGSGSTPSTPATPAPAPTPAPDTTPPTVPISLTAAAVSSSQINLTWAASTDNVGVAGYKIYRNGSLLTSVTTGTTYSDTGLTSSTTYSYSVSAYDAAGNVSVQSASVSATTSPNSSSSSTTTSSSAGVTYISDLQWVGTPVNGFGPVNPQKDQSNGDGGAGTQGTDIPGNSLTDYGPHTITLHGVTYAKGLGVHAISNVTYNLGGQYSSFVSDIGIDDEVGSGGSVVFQVYADGVKLYDSGIMTHDSPTQTINVDVTGKNQLQLVVNVGNTSTSDHADWAGAHLVAGGAPPIVPTSSANTSSLPAGSAYISDLNWTSATNGWGPLPRKDTSNGENCTAPAVCGQHTITLNGVTYAKGLGVNAVSEITYNLAGQYKRFVSNIGIDDETSSGSVIFQVWADGIQLYDSGIMNKGTAAQTVDVDLTGRSQLQLIVKIGSTSDGDHADWAGAYLY
jgi:hypothetical protein